MNFNIGTLMKTLKQINPKGYNDLNTLKQNDYGLDNYRTEDVYLVMNQGFNDYRDKLLGDDITNYVKYTDAFIDDEDSIKDKITKYFTIIPK